MKRSQVNAKRQKMRMNIDLFSALIKTPVTGAVTLPAGARFAFKAKAVTSAGTTAGTIQSATLRTIKTPALAIGGLVIIDFISRGSVVTPAANFDLMVDAGLGKYVKIAGA